MNSSPVSFRSETWKNESLRELDTDKRVPILVKKNPSNSHVVAFKYIMFTPPFPFVYLFWLNFDFPWVQIGRDHFFLAKHLATQAPARKRRATHGLASRRALTSHWSGSIHPLACAPRTKLSHINVGTIFSEQHQNILVNIPVIRNTFSGKLLRRRIAIKTIG